MHLRKMQLFRYSFWSSKSPDNRYWTIAVVEKWMKYSITKAASSVRQHITEDRLNKIQLLLY